ncbi:MAG: TVP38/TMEM64 family protein [Anaerolineae bacterium]|nr:TVP38/TMEM64 family protein [Anaerolineae bacterium]
MTPGHAVRLIIAAALIVAAAVGLWQWGPAIWGFFRDQPALQAWLISFGAWTPLVSIAVSAMQVVFAPIPGQATGLVNGYLFGVWLGAFYSLFGVMLGTGTILALTRHWGRPLTARLVPAAQLEKLDYLAERRGELFFFLIFLLPFLPDDLTCFAIGLTRLSIGRMLVLIALGRLPGLIVASWMGAHARSVSPLGWAILIAGVCLLALAYWRWRSIIETRLLGWLERVTRR